jgi:hypothetical protein
MYRLAYSFWGLGSVSGVAMFGGSEAGITLRGKEWGKGRAWGQRKRQGREGGEGRGGKGSKRSEVGHVPLDLVRVGAIPRKFGWRIHCGVEVTELSTYASSY